MKIYNVLDLASKKNGECVLGSSELKTDACYLVFGILEPYEKGRVLKPGKGHEEIVCLVSGEALITGEENTISVKKGDAFHLREEDRYLMDNAGAEAAVYAIAGGHCESHSH